MSAPATALESALDFIHADEPVIAHFFCIAEFENDVHLGLCRTPLRGISARWKDQWCSVCVHIVDDHRAQCPPCMAKWGPADKNT